MRALAKIARARGLKRIDWTVAKDNAGAIAFYDRLGAGALADRWFYRLSGEAFDALGDDDA
jgi:ribosomal protein S18 acetylase RimI-like enzyme